MRERPFAARISVVIVTHEARADLERSLPPLLEELAPEDELFVSDNASSDGTAELAAELAPGAVVLRNGRNLGFAAGANAGAYAATGKLLVLLNPDATVAPGWREAILGPLREEPRFDAWMGLVTMDGGQRVNTSGGVVHFTGIAWAGEYGGLAGEVAAEPREAGFASGACLAIPLARWRELGGMPAGFFLYHEDVDLSLRVRLAGGTVGVVPAARVDHDYSFAKGALKWRMLERNRWATLLRTYPGTLLALLLPALAATELALVVVAARQGWLRQKLLAWGDMARALPRLLRERQRVQATRRVSAAAFAAGLTPELSSPYLGRAGRTAPLDLALRAYWRAVTALLAVGRRDGDCPPRS